MIKKISFFSLMLFCFNGVLLAQITSFPIKDGGQGYLLCSDSLMLFTDGSAYTKTAKQQNWNKLDSIRGLGGSFALNGTVIYSILSKSNSSNWQKYSTEIYVSYDKGMHWQLRVPATTFDSMYYGYSFYATDSALYFSSQSGNIYNYNLFTDTLLTLYERPLNSTVFIRNFKLYQNQVYFIYSDFLYRVDTVNQLDTVAQIVNALSQTSFEIEDSKIAIATVSGNYFSTDSGLSWTLDSSATYDTTTTFQNNRVVALHKGVFYSVTSSYPPKNFRNHKANFSYSTDGIHWQRDSMFFYRTFWFSTITGIQFSANRIFLNTAIGVFEYDTVQHQFFECNKGIKENQVSCLATNSDYHIIQDRFSVTVRNLSTGVDEDITSYLPSLNDSILWNYSSLGNYDLDVKSSFTITENNKIYYQIGAVNSYIWNDKLFVSADLGHSWRLVDTAVVLNYFATNDSLFYATDQKLYRSFDAGISATEVSISPSLQSLFYCQNKDRHRIQGKNGDLYLTSCVTWLQGGVDYLVHYSNDFGATWRFEKSFYQSPEILQQGNYDLAYDAGFYKKEKGDSIWNVQYSPIISLSSYHNKAGGYTAFEKNRDYFVVKNSLASDDIIIYELDNTCNFAYPIFHTNQFKNLYVQLKEENNVISLVPKVKSASYFLFNDTNSTFLGTASGRVIYDSNFNSVADSLDAPFSGAIISNKLSGGMSNANGFYFIPLTQASDTLYAFTNQKYTTISPASLPAHPHDSTLNFFVSTIPGINDLSIHAALSAIPRPGFRYTTFLTCKNEGTTSPYFTVKYVNKSGTQTIQTNPTVNSVSGDTLIWNFFGFGLAPMQTWRIAIVDSVSTSDSIGRILSSWASINTVAPDTFPNDNTVNLVMSIHGAIDPNEKSVEPQIFTSNNMIAGDYLTYTIRFQNTGNAAAGSVWIEDTLSSLLDISTIQTIAASSNYYQSIKEGNVLSYFFFGIQLSDSSSNEAKSHGFVSFKIKPKSTWNLGDSICNKAHIYFDYNEAVATNTVSTILVQPNMLNTMSLNDNAFAYPNPTQEFISVQTIKGKYAYKIFNEIGQLLLSKPENISKEIDVSILSNGIYFLEIVNSEKTERVKFIKQ